VPYPAPAAYAATAPHTLSPQVVRASSSWRDVDVDDNPFARRSRRGRRWAAFFVVAALVGGCVAVAKLRPQAVPPVVAHSVERYAGPVTRWVASTAAPAFAQARTFVLARVAPTPHGESLAQDPAAGTPSVVTPPEVTQAAAPPPPAVTVSAKDSALSARSATANDPSVIDVMALPVARADSAADAKAAPHGAPPSPARGAAPRPAPLRSAVTEAKPRPSRAPADDDSAPAPAPKPAPVAKAPPPVNTAPAPAPGSLDDLIRKAVEADAKKKH
jgi:hypothetical protein